MELSRKEIYRNQKVSLGVTLLSFVVMLAFFMFTKVITSNSSSFVTAPQITLSMENGGPEHSASPGEQKYLASSSQKESPASKVLVTQAETSVQEGAADIANKYKTSRFVSTSVNTAVDAPEPGDPEKQKGEKNTSDVTTALGFNLEGRKLLAKPGFINSTQEEGTVVVDITVDKNGIVTDADPNGRGTNTGSSSLKREAAKMALATKFNSQQKFEEQRGTITIIFSFQ